MECSLCRDVFTNPKTLPCLHTFCLQCLELFISKASTTSIPTTTVERKTSKSSSSKKKSKSTTSKTSKSKSKSKNEDPLVSVEIESKSETSNQDSLKVSQTHACPLCRTPFEISIDELSSLPTNIFILNQLQNQSTQNEDVFCEICEDQRIAKLFCIQCNQYFCEACEKIHRKIKKTANDEFITVQEAMKGNLEPKSMTCKVHVQKEIDSFCEDCEYLTCIECLPTHNSHSVTQLKDSTKLSKCRDEIEELVKQVCISFSFSLFFCFFPKEIQ